MNSQARNKHGGFNAFRRSTIHQRPGTSVPSRQMLYQENLYEILRKREHLKDVRSSGSLEMVNWKYRVKTKSDGALGEGKLSATLVGLHSPLHIDMGIYYAAMRCSGKMRQSVLLVGATRRAAKQQRADVPFGGRHLLQRAIPLPPIKNAFAMNLE